MITIVENVIDSAATENEAHAPNCLGCEICGIRDPVEVEDPYDLDTDEPNDSNRITYQAGSHNEGPLPEIRLPQLFSLSKTADVLAKPGETRENRNLIELNVKSSENTVPQFFHPTPPPAAFFRRRPIAVANGGRKPACADFYIGLDPPYLISPDLRIKL